MLIQQIERRATGDQHDDMAWIEIIQMALTLMNQRDRVVYFTEDEPQAHPGVLDNAKSDAYHEWSSLTSNDFRLWSLGRDFVMLICLLVFDIRSERV